MTSWSIRSSNAIKSSPGKSFSGVNSIGEVNSQENIPVNPDTLRFFSKEHIALIAASVRSPELMLVFICSLCVFFGLLTLRVFDDNKLTSWHWLFVNADLLTVSFYLVSGLLASLLFINISVSRYQALLALIFFSIFIPILHWGNPEVILDAGRYFSQAKYLEIYGFAYFLEQWGQGIMAWTDLPLVPFIYGILFKVFGETRIVIQVINTIFFSGTVFVTYCLGRHLWNHRVGLYGASMLLAMPYLHTQVSLMMVDIAAMFFLMLTVLLYVRAITIGGKWNIALTAAAIVLTMLTKYTSWIMLSVLPVICVVYYRNTGYPVEKKQILNCTRNVFIVFTLFASIPLLWGYEVFLQQIQLLVNYQLAILNGWTESHVSTFLFQMHPAVAVSALIALYMGYKRRDNKIFITSWMLLLIFLLDIERIRYVLIVFPMLALMAGYAIAGLNKREIRRYLTLSVLVTASTVSILGHASFLKENSAINIQEAADYIHQLKYPAVEVITLEQTQSSANPIISLPLFDLYTQKEVVRNGIYGSNEHELTADQLTSTLRFTWEYSVPDYYRRASQNDKNIIVVISSDESQALPGVIREKLSGYNMDKRFYKDEGIFRYKTIVDIYLPSGNGK